MFLLVSVLLFLSIPLKFSYSQNCETKETCDECIREDDCDWCMSPMGNSSTHCRSKFTTNWCTDKNRVSLPSAFNILHDKNFSDNEEPIQVKPQRVKLSLRKGEKFVLNFKYKSTKNYPIDMYYLTDLSHSMKNFTNELGNLASKLSDTMRSLTSKFKLGYGSFIDKSALPFATMRNFELTDPCTGCAKSYSFKNHLSLSEDFKTFKKKIEKSEFSGNLDSPEGGLDALMQVMVCKRQIGWRNQARHLIVFSTDSLSHTAGDGKLAGIVEPNPAVCYESNNDYLTYDYPSISHINYIANKNNYNIIFAIVPTNNELKESYRWLSENIRNSKYGFIDGSEGRDVVDLILQNYKEIEQTVKFTSNATKAIDVKFSTACNGSTTERCNKVHVGEVLSINATIQPRECLPNGQKEYIWLKPEGLNESLIVELEVTCDCPCSKTVVNNSTRCSSIGYLKCGVCSCPQGRFGKDCECDNLITNSGDSKNCIMEGTSEICSGLGNCNNCGKCECHENTNGENYGQFCQCNDYLCRKVDGVLCSGKGKCKCNVCECQAGYSGQACECSENENTCFASGSAEKCSNHGNCKCGHCQCDKGYSGEFCQECISCPEGHKDRCKVYRLCVECKAYGTMLQKDDCEEKCKNYNVTKVEKLDESSESKREICHEHAENGIMHFSYDHENGKINVKVFKESVHDNFLKLILGLPIATLLLGLLCLLIWKITVTIHDRREYAKFENERRAMKWHTDENPLYKEATMTFANPAYNRNRASRLDRDKHTST